MSIIRNLLNSKTRLTVLLFLFLIVSLGSCTFSDKQTTGHPLGNDYEKVDVEYAERLEIYEGDGKSVIRVRNPWQQATNVVKDFVIYRNGKAKENELKPPFKRVICLSSSHVGFMEKIEEVDRIVGISGAGYICSKAVRQRIDEGKIKEIGHEGNMNYELIASLNPDLFIGFMVGAGAQKMIDRLESLDIPVILIADYLEKTPLGRAEWLRAFGVLFNNQQVDSLISETAQRYNELALKVRDVKSRPLVLSGLPYKGTWYVPGNDTYAGTFINDAGGDYLWQDIEADVVPMELEKVYERALHADVWINPGLAGSIHEIVSTDARLKNLSVVKNGRIANNNRIRNNAGGIDYYESGVVNPDIILQDLIQIFHPDQLPEKKMHYYQYLN
jgi:iron complex transport system substrate-binding protein